LNILIVTPHFFPENFRINDFAEEFQKRGHNISVLSAIPDYPEGKYYEGYGIFKKCKEIYNGIKIYRAPLIPRGSGSNVRLALNYFTFVLGSFFPSLFILKNKIDIIFVFGVSPITIGFPAIFIKKIKKIPICFWVLDLWPESVVSAGNLKSPILLKILNYFVKYIYKHSDKILVSSNGFIKSITEKGVSKNKIEFFPQWAEPIFKPVKPVKNFLKTTPGKNFKIMFAGNFGEAQDFPSILEAANNLKNENINWIFLGSGRKLEWVKLKIKEYGLENCVQLLGNHPIEKMPTFYASADALLLSLKNENIFSITIPAKLQSYLACGKPILAMINGESGKIIADANAGLVCPAGCPINLSENILKMTLMKDVELKNLGENARKYYEKNFERSYLLDKAENIFRLMKFTDE